MINEFRTIDVTTLRQKTNLAFKSLAKGGPLFVFRRSQPKAVLLDTGKYAEIVEALEDFADAQEIEKSLREPVGNFTHYIKKRWGKI